MKRFSDDEKIQKLAGVGHNHLIASINQSRKKINQSNQKDLIDWFFNFKIFGMIDLIDCAASAISKMIDLIDCAAGEIFFYMLQVSKYLFSTTF